MVDANFVIDTYAPKVRRIVRPRDKQRLRVYRCAWALMDSSKRLETLPEMQAFVDALMLKVWNAGLYAAATRSPVQVKAGQARRRAIAFRNEIRMPKWSRCELIVCHELAHSISTRLYDETVAHHAPEWCSIYLTLTKLAISVDMAQRLAVEFRRNGVDYTVHRIRGL